MARPTKFTPERRARFLAALRMGGFRETAAAHAGWSPATFYRIRSGTTPAHVAFLEELRRVETELELRLAGTVTQAAFSDPRLALAMLERRFGERWGRRGTVVGAAVAERTSEHRDAGVVVLEPALIEAVIPTLLAARLGPAASPDALTRVERFARPVGEDEETDA